MERCRIPVVWCGNGPVPRPRGNKRYTRKGTAHECLKVGVGAGMYSERKKTLPATSVQHIPYIGPVHERNFASNRIRTLNDLRTRMKSLSKKGKRDLLVRVLQKKGGGLDKRAYNSVIYYLYERKMKDLPLCDRI